MSRREYVQAYRSAWGPPKPLRPSEWAEAHYVLAEGLSSEPGPYRLARTPYAAGILDALGAGYQEVVVQAPAQVGKSEIARIWICWSCSDDPGPVMVVYPTEDAAEEQIEERIIPAFRASPRLRELLTARAWDLKKSRIRLTTCTINIGWAGSPQALASRPERRVVMDEVNKWPPYRGREGDPLARARARTASYGALGQVYVVSTPTTPEGAVTVAYEGCVDRRGWHVPCPGCGAWDELAWDHVEWPGQHTTDETELHEQKAGLEAGLIEAVYVCERCGYRARDSERWPMVTAGEWVSDGFPRGERPASKSVGFRICGLASPWTSWSNMALRYVNARIKGIGALHSFYNSDLGVPFWAGPEDGGTKLAEVSPQTLFHKAGEARAADYPRGVVPRWATHVLASADPGKTGAHYAIRAWGPGYRSRLLAAGEVESLEGLRAAVLDRRFPREDGAEPMRPSKLVIDTGGGMGTVNRSRTDEIHRWAKAAGPVVAPLKGFGGAGSPTMPVLTRSHQYHPPGEQAKPYDVTLSVVDTEYFKDLTASRIAAADGTLWEVGCALPQEYVMQVAAERKTLIERRVKPTGEVSEVFRWRTRVPGAPNHYWDCEVYQSVAAYMIDMDRRRGQPIRPGTKREDDERADDPRAWRIGR